MAELKARFSELLREVEREEEVEVTDRGRAIARIIPGAKRARILAAARPFASLRRRRFRPAGWAVSSLDLLLEERRQR